MIATLLEESLLSAPFRRLGYWAPFLFLLGAGAGLPVPEEVTMTGSGYLVYIGEVDFLAVTLTCLVATLLGDTIPYGVGRFLGRRVLRHRFLAHLLHEERMVGLEERMRRHGTRALLTIRFLPGLRLPGYFTAGVLRMPFPRFLLLDGLAACVMTPGYVLLGRAFGGSIAAVEREVQNYGEWLGLVLVVLVTSVVVHGLVRRSDRRRLGAQGEEGADSGR